MMRKLLAFLFVLMIGGGATWAQNAAPGTEYFMGGTLGKQWLPANSQNAGIRNVTGTTDTILATDMGKLVTYNNAGAVAVTLPAATTTGFGAFTRFHILNIGAGTVTVTPTTSTVNGGATKAYAQNASGIISSDGTNYWAH
jgi:hypothetical protein